MPITVLVNKKWNLDPISLFSHELKTPLSSLKIAVELLKENPNQKDILNLMDEELNKMISFIQDKLDEATLKNKKTIYNLKWNSWNQMIQELTSSLSFILKKHQVYLKVENHSSPQLEVFMDALWIQQLLKNLILNSIKESPKKSSIYLSYKMTKEGLEVSVQDEGTGFFSLKENSSLFDKDPSPHLNNTGLGLIISQDIAKAHKTEVKIDSHAKGGFFFFTLLQARKFQKSA